MNRTNLILRSTPKGCVSKDGPQARCVWPMLRDAALSARLLSMRCALIGATTHEPSRGPALVRQLRLRAGAACRRGRAGARLDPRRGALCAAARRGDAGHGAVARGAAGDADRGAAGAGSQRSGARAARAAAGRSQADEDRGRAGRAAAAGRDPAGRGRAAATRPAAAARPEAAGEAQAGRTAQAAAAQAEVQSPPRRRQRPTRPSVRPHRRPAPRPSRRRPRCRPGRACCCGTWSATSAIPARRSARARRASSTCASP